jgi:hypothetical protein
MIEPAWAYLKRITTKNGPLRTRKEATEAWQKAWNELEQNYAHGNGAPASIKGDGIIYVYYSMN